MSKFKLFHYHLNTDKLSRGSKGLTFVLMADMHNHVYGPGNELLLKAVEEQKPDAVLVAGDMLIAHSEESFTPALELFRGLRERRLPVFYGNGNHEYRMRLRPKIYGTMYQEYTKGLRDCGVILLENERISFEKNGFKMRIYGFELDWCYYEKLNHIPFQPGELTNVFGTPDGEYYNILLAHNPVYFDSYAVWGADLTVSGHLHGGIIRIPGIGGVISPQAKLFPKYDAGHFKKDGRDLVVSRGLGTHTVNIRIFNPAELSVIYLHPKESSQ
ncbi:MAG: hypothetical protein HFI28_05285 [Lachnospiraceae bacterium]|jgi:predicted MPP superfamily phosphohydrolase|nr:hypothetical protein [Lachnospiraceae bacterium]